MRITLLALLCCTLAGVATATPPYLHKETGLTLPETLAGLALFEVKDYDFEGHPAVCADYSGQGTEATIYFRPFNPGKDLSASGIVEQAFAVIREFEKSGRYSNVVSLAHPPGEDTPGWACLAFTASKDGTPIRSFIYATIKSSYVIKVRLTSINPRDLPVQTFIDAFQKLVNASSPH